MPVALVGRVPEPRQCHRVAQAPSPVGQPGAAVPHPDATLTSKVQTVSLSIGGCATGSRLLVTPQNIPDGLALTKAACTGNGAAAITFTNYTTDAKSGSVTVSGVYPEARREVIR